MASAFQNAWQTALEAEGKLLKSLAEKEPTFTEISHYLTEFRAACQNAILQDFETSRSIDVETRLWDAHVKINARFRKLLSRFREENAKKKKPVERRKLEKHYLDFIKSSQRFYRGYIQQLSSHFGGIPELEKVARKFNFDNLSAQPPVETSDALRASVLQSCHSTLIRLGDLSRYRETELVSKDRNWGPAIGYYDLAIAIFPASGASHNQLAVIALADGNHLRATYHLYRALAAQEPHPSAKGNLEIEFRKVRHAWRKRELIRPEDAGIPGRALAPWFVYLHAQCYKGNDFPEHDELESEVLNQLAVDLKERSLEGTLQKFCLINIAAEDFSWTQPDESVSNSRLFFQRINVKTFFTLLQILLAELERFAVEDSLSKDAKSGPDKITAVARRVLPALRHYSSWLLIVSHSLVAHKEEKDTPLAVQITEFWKIYANTLSLLASTFDVVHLPEIDYLLEEDEETLGFVPLNKDAASRRYLSATGQQKPRMTDVGVERSHPNIEMLYRIREFVIDGLDLVVSNRIPIALVDDEDKKTFIYKEEGLPSQFFASPSGNHNTLSTASVEREDVQQVTKDANYAADSRSTFGGSQSASASMSANMHRIVEGVERLVESDTYENAPTLPDQLTFLRSTNQQPIPNNFFESSLNSTLRETDAPARYPPIAPPGLQLSMPNPTAGSAAPLSQSYTSRPTLPGIPSIWSTGLSPDMGGSSVPRTPPGLGQHPGQANTTDARSPDPRHASHDMTTNELIFRKSLVGQTSMHSLLGGSTSMSPWMSSSTPAAYHGLSETGWDRSPPGRAASPPSLGVPSQPMSSGLANASWANDAFLASTLSSGAGFPSSGPTSRRSASHFGAIGQTPSYGQGG